MPSRFVRLLSLGLLATLAATTARAQGTAFTYQGRLDVGGTPAAGAYQMRFTLYDALTGGGAVAGPLTLDVPVTAGTFSVTLDFGACPACFDGSARFLEIAVRPAGSPDPVVVLEPRQAITPAPYAMRSTVAGTAETAMSLQGLDASGFVHNGTGAQTASFNITGNGTIGGSLSVGGAFTLAIVNATARYDLAGTRVLAAGGFGSSNLAVGQVTGNPEAGQGNTYVGTAAGLANASGEENTFVGMRAGAANMSGGLNAFFGTRAGEGNTTGGHNAFFGAYAGGHNTSGIFNAFFGRGTGGSNTTGGYNAMFGAGAGDRTTTGSGNAFFGASSGNFNVTGDDNSFFGREAGLNNTASGNAFFGRSAGRANTSGNYNTFVGLSAGAANADFSLSSYFGAYAGAASTGCCNAFFGAFAGSQNVTGAVNAFFGQAAGSLNTGGAGNAFFGQQAGGDLVTGQGNTNGSFNTFLGNHSGTGNTTGSNNTLVGAEANVGGPALAFATALGAGATVGTSNTVVLGRAADTVVVPGNLTVAGTINGGSGGGAFILNGTTVQTSANFSIDGTGAAASFTAGDYRLGGTVYLSTSAEGTNLFLGPLAGAAPPTGGSNVFVGGGAGQHTTSGLANNFFGSYSGGENLGGSGNAFFGSVAGSSNTEGSNNTFVGMLAGETNVTGSWNTLVGYQAFGGAALDNTAAIGAYAQVTQANSLVLGSIAGINNATADTRVGIGTTAPRAKLEVAAGDVYVNGPANGLVLKSPNGSCWRVTVGNTGALATAAITCP